jgi:hypothetical protein
MSRLVPPRLVWPLLVLPLAAGAQTAGRWEGSVQVPGAPQPIVIDFDGRAGAVTLPGRGTSGAPLRDVQATDRRLAASLTAAIAAFGAPTAAPAIELERQPDGRLSGTFRQGGQAAPVVLTRTGDAQVPAPRVSTALGREYAGVWKGRYELFGYPRDVTLTLKDGPPAPGNAKLVIVGRRHNDIPIDRVVQGPTLVSFESHDAGMTVEGRLVDGRLDALLLQGALEIPLMLRREGAPQ